MLHTNSYRYKKTALSNKKNHINFCIFKLKLVVVVVACKVWRSDIHKNLRFMIINRLRKYITSVLPLVILISLFVSIIPISQVPYC